MTTPLEEIIKEQIRCDGPMRLDDYMRLCLGHPEHGYYMTRDPFGQAGDFTTAPEISQLFGEMIGVWVADTWMKMGQPDPFILLECGPGRGTLMADLMRATKRVAGLHEAVQIMLLETSPVLKQKQAQALDPYAPVWIETLAPERFTAPVIVIGNEFLDALPIRQYRFDGAQCTEKYIVLNNNDTLQFKWIESKPNQIVKNLLTQKSVKSMGHIEVSDDQYSVLMTLSKIIQKQCGNTLFIDYGSVHYPVDETLQALKNHQRRSVLELPGECDITSHVGFGLVKDWLEEGGMAVHGPVSQGIFLKRLGIDVRAQQLQQNASEAQALDLSLALQRLTGQGDARKEMGSLFKVIAFGDNPDIKLAGFHDSDY